MNKGVREAAGQTICLSTKFEGNIGLYLGSRWDTEMLLLSSIRQALLRVCFFQTLFPVLRGACSPPQEHQDHISSTYNLTMKDARSYHFLQLPRSLRTEKTHSSNDSLTTEMHYQMFLAPSLEHLRLKNQRFIYICRSGIIKDV